MKTILLNKPITDFKGNAIKIDGTRDMSVADVIIFLLGQAKGKDAKENFLLYDLGISIAKSNGSVEVDDVSFPLLKRVVEDNTNGFPALWLTPALKAVQEAT